MGCLTYTCATSAPARWPAFLTTDDIDIDFLPGVGAIFRSEISAVPFHPAGIPGACLILPMVQGMAHPVFAVVVFGQHARSEPTSRPFHPIMPVQYDVPASLVAGCCSFKASFFHENICGEVMDLRSPLVPELNCQKMRTCSNSS